MSLLQGYYQRVDIDGAVTATFYVGESPPGDEWRLEGTEWVLLADHPIADRLLDGDPYTEEITDPPGWLPAPPG
jgi:hypothetical protein